MSDTEAFGVETEGKSMRPNNPPWWAWAIISILMAEAAWFANATIALEAEVAALSAQYVALNDNVNRLMNSWGRSQ